MLLRCCDTTRTDVGYSLWLSGRVQSAVWTSVSMFVCTSAVLNSITGGGILILLNMNHMLLDGAVRLHFEYLTFGISNTVDVQICEVGSH